MTKYCSICGQPINDPFNPSSFCKDCEKLPDSIKPKPIRWRKKEMDKR